MTVTTTGASRGSITRMCLHLQVISFILPASMAVSVGPVSLLPYRVFTCLFAIIWLMEKDILNRNRNRLPAEISIIVVILAYTLLQGLYAPAYASSVSNWAGEWIHLLSVALMCVGIMTLVTTRRDILAWYHLILVMMIVEVGIGYYEHFTEQHLACSRLVIQDGIIFFDQSVPTGTFYNPNAYAVFLGGAGIFLLPSLWLRDSKRWYKIIVATTFAFSLPAILWTGSRAMILVEAIAIMTTACVLASTSRRNSRIIFTWGLAVLVVLAVIVTQIVPFSELEEKLCSELSTIENTSARLPTLVNSLHVAWTTLGIGSGLATSEALIEQGFMVIERSKIGGLCAVWSLPAEVVASCGLPGIVFWGVLIMGAFRKSLGHFRIAQDDWRPLFASCVMSVPVGVLCTFADGGGLSAWYVWFHIGMAAACVKVFVSQRTTIRDRIPRRVVVRQSVSVDLLGRRYANGISGRS